MKNSPGVNKDNNSLLIYVDNIKLFAKNESDLKTLIQTLRIYRQDIGMEFGTEKCAKLVTKCRKRHRTEGIELPNQKKKLERLEKRKPTNTWGYCEDERKNF